jgi:pyruvate formate lyase activating enzyme
MIAGLQKMTLLDYPGKVACTLFLQGCNFRCPFCHNSGLLSGAGEEGFSKEEFLQFLGKRRGILDGVCVTGGEPTLQPGLEELLRQIKSLGFAVKLDTNGSRPAVLKRLVEEKLVDYVAMDVKNGPDAYGTTVGVPALNLEPIEESLRFLLQGNVAYELRTTVVAQLHDEASVQQMGQWLAGLVPGKKAEKLFLQFFTDRESVLRKGLSAHDRRTMEEFAEILTPYIGKVSVRGG